jgi:hypothetical protein
VFTEGRSQSFLDSVQALLSNPFIFGSNSATKIVKALAQALRITQAESSCHCLKARQTVFAQLFGEGSFNAVARDTDFFEGSPLTAASPLP